MPRQTRKRISDPAAEAGSAQNAGSPSDTPSPDDTLLFNTTFSLQRISPLFVGSEPLTSERLRLLAGRLRDTLVGDVARGVEIGLDGNDAAMGNAGALETVAIEWATVEAVINTEQKALRLSLQYENALSIALLLPSIEEDQGNGAFIHLPLLLLRMPTPLKTVIADFLSNTFDCRISPLRLRNSDLVKTWEVWIQEAGLPTSGLLAKDAVLTLGFRLPESKKPTDQDGSKTEVDGSDGTGIKSIDIIIPAHDLRQFLRAGKALDRGDATEHPFTDALAHYLKQHLAMDISHPGVRVARVASGGFVLSEGRLKMFASPDGTIATSSHRAAVQRLVGDLVNRAKGVASVT